MAKFKVGDSVRLNSGGAFMTVVINDDPILGVRCTWLKKNGELAHGSFPEEALHLATDDDNKPAEETDYPD